MEGTSKMYTFVIVGILLMLALLVISISMHKNMSGLASGTCLYADKTMGYTCPCDDQNMYDSELVKNNCPED
jgi:hypothetical protein